MEYKTFLSDEELQLMQEDKLIEKYFIVGKGKGESKLSRKEISIIESISNMESIHQSTSIDKF